MDHVPTKNPLRPYTYSGVVVSTEYTKTCLTLKTIFAHFDCQLNQAHFGNINLPTGKTISYYSMYAVLGGREMEQN